MATTHTRRQIAVRLLPFLFVLYVTNYLDRTSVAYAALEMSRDLGFTDRVFGLGAGIFFISYVALQIPGALLVELWSARRCIGVIMVAWGSLTVLTGLVHTANQLYLARLVLGAAEAGFFPGVVVYLSHWFIREDRAKATEQLYGGDSLVVHYRVAGGRMDSGPSLAGFRGLALACLRWRACQRCCWAWLRSSISRIGRCRLPGCIRSSATG